MKGRLHENRLLVDMHFESDRLSIDKTVCEKGCTANISIHPKINILPQKTISFLRLIILKLYHVSYLNATKIPFCDTDSQAEFQKIFYGLF